MYTCTACGKKFKTIRALGGHTSSAHPQDKGEIMPASNNPEPPEAEATAEVRLLPQAQPSTPNEQPSTAGTPSKDTTQSQNQSAQLIPTNDEPGIMETIREYKKRRLSAKQIKDLGYARKTVDQVFLEGIVPEGNPEGGERQDNNLPMVYKQTEVISTEALLRRYTDGSYEDDLKLRGKMELVAAVLVAKELANVEKASAEADAKRLEPFMKLLTVSREELDASAARARGSNLEIAETAAEAAAGRIASYIDQKIPKGPPPKNIDEAFAKPMGRIVDLMTDMMEKKLFPQMPDKPPQEWEVEDVKPPSPGLPLNQKPAVADTPRGTAQGWTEEEKESGEDV